MSENEIINDLECCSRKECSRCSRQGVVGCSDGLVKDAIQAIKLQKSHLDNASKDINRLQEECRSMKTMLKYDFSLKDMVSRINRVIKESIEHGGEESNWDGLISSTRDLLRMIDKQHELVLVLDGDKPEIQFRERLTRKE